ncbi:MAG: hypothetical protein K5854_09565 [Prevotella sp.]|nr:hypothetical protein [Prevotella sp.]
MAEILPLESADMQWIIDGLGEPFPFPVDDKVNENEEPCWSLAALLSVLPEGIIDNCYVPNLQKENGKYSIAYGDDELLCIADNPIDACYEMILKLHELKML